MSRMILLHVTVCSFCFHVLYVDARLPLAIYTHAADYLHAFSGTLHFVFSAGRLLFFAYTVADRGISTKRN